MTTTARTTDQHREIGRLVELCDRLERIGLRDMDAARVASARLTLGALAPDGGALIEGALTAVDDLLMGLLYGPCWRGPAVVVDEPDWAGLAEDRERLRLWVLENC